MKHRATAGRESVQHKRYITDVNYRSAGLYTALLGLAVPAIPAMPGARALYHPAFCQRREAWRARRTRLHFDVPASSMLGHPGVQGVVVILRICKDRHETRKVVGRDVGKQGRGGLPSARPTLVMRTASNNPSVSTNTWRLCPVMFLPPSYPRSWPPISVVLTT
jgi:hypothetical protein